jgi:hypothetical protein
VGFRIHHRSQVVNVEIDHTVLRLRAAPGATGSGVRVDVGGVSRLLRPGEAAEFSVGNHPVSSHAPAGDG